MHYFSCFKISSKNGLIKSRVPPLRFLIHKQYIFFIENFLLYIFYLKLFIVGRINSEISTKRPFFFFWEETILAIFCENSCLYTIQIAFSSNFDVHNYRVQLLSYSKILLKESIDVFPISDE